MNLGTAPGMPHLFCQYLYDELYKRIIYILILHFYSEEDQVPSYTLSFNMEFPYDNDHVYLAHCYPYTYSDLQDYLIQLQNHPVKSTFSKLRLLCRSLAGNNVYYLTITAPSLGEEARVSGQCTFLEMGTYKHSF
jgi:hypothetical protein